MKWTPVCVLAAMMAALAAPTASAQQLLANPGFEDPITSDGAPFVGFWEGFSGGAGATSANDATMPRTGAQHLNLSITNTDNTFAGVFQDVPGLSAGQPFVFSGWHKRTTTPLDLDAEVRIEWRNSGSDAEISRTPNFLPVLTTDYAPFALNANVPAGADTARVVYAIQTFTGGPTNNGQVFLDDMLAAIVPEPASALMAGFGVMGWLGLARRR